MRINVLTLFPRMFEGFLSVSIVKRAIENGIVDVNLCDLRDYAIDRHKTVDDYSYGGGEGMVIKLPVVAAALDSLSEKGKIILMSPRGKRLTQADVESFAKEDVITIICGHYEGVDERVVDMFNTYELSIGDYVLTGGELPAMVFMDAVVRTLPGVLGREDAFTKDSFASGLLEYPHYTRPAEYKGYKVPEVLISGNHEEIDRWRLRESISVTLNRRPDLFYSTSPVAVRKKGVHLILVHYPVKDRGGRIVSTAIANLDVHDISRSCRTFGVRHFWIVTPLASQRELVKKIVSHWTEGYGAEYNPMRKEALSRIKVVASIDDAIKRITSKEKDKPVAISTTARKVKGAVTFSFIRHKLFVDYDRPFAIILGTGWGLVDDVINNSDYTLEPVLGYDDYNHLSVRSAAAIILDRLLGVRRD